MLYLWMTVKGPTHAQAACPVTCANQACAGQIKRVWVVEAACAGRQRGRLRNLAATGWLRPANVRYRRVFAFVGKIGQKLSVQH